jgi:hypothetical protein
MADVVRIGPMSGFRSIFEISGCFCQAPIGQEGGVAEKNA